MNELVWEGLLEILREGQPSLKAAAHLWRRDDISGSDWGGQLELPVVFRRLLPAEEYQVRLPSGTEARVRIASGPSTTTMTFPTLTGIGQPPFGAPASRSHGDIDADENAEEQVAPPAAPSGRRAADAPRVSRERGMRAEAVSRSHRSTAAPQPPPAPAAPPASAPEPVAEAPAPAEDSAAPEEASPPAPEPPRAAPRRTTARTRAERPAVALVSRVESQQGTDTEESVEHTEALARAFLAAIEARQAIKTLELPGFQGRAIAAATVDVEHIASALESALRATNGATEWVEPLRQRLTTAAWFASLAAPDEVTELATAGQAVQALVHSIDGYLAISADAWPEAHAA